jgi:hypothetical protein
MLLAILIHAEALKVNIPAGAKLRLHRPRDVNRRLHGQLLHATFHDGEIDRNHTRHLNSATERNLAITLREMQIPDGELRSLHVHGKVHFAATRQVLDIAVAAVLGAPWNRASALFADFLFGCFVCAAGVHILGLRGESYVAVHVRAGFDQAGFALVPGVEDFGRGRAAEDSWVDEAGEFDAGDVAGGAVDAFEVPDCFCSGVMLGGGRGWSWVGHRRVRTVLGRSRRGSRLRSPWRRYLE